MSKLIVSAKHAKELIKEFTNYGTVMDFFDHYLIIKRIPSGRFRSVS